MFRGSPSGVKETKKWLSFLIYSLVCVTGREKWSPAAALMLFGCQGSLSPILMSWLAFRPDMTRIIAPMLW